MGGSGNPAGAAECKKTKKTYNCNKKTTKNTKKTPKNTKHTPKNTQKSLKLKTELITVNFRTLL